MDPKVQEPDTYYTQKYANYKTLSERELRNILSKDDNALFSLSFLLMMEKEYTDKGEFVGYFTDKVGSTKIKPEIFAAVVKSELLQRPDIARLVVEELVVGVISVGGISEDKINPEAPVVTSVTPELNRFALVRTSTAATEPGKLPTVEVPADLAVALLAGVEIDNTDLRAGRWLGNSSATGVRMPGDTSWIPLSVMIAATGTNPTAADLAAGKSTTEALSEYLKKFGFNVPDNMAAAFADVYSTQPAFDAENGILSVKVKEQVRRLTGPQLREIITAVYDEHDGTEVAPNTALQVEMEIFRRWEAKGFPKDDLLGSAIEIPTSSPLIPIRGDNDNDLPLVRSAG